MHPQSTTVWRPAIEEPGPDTGTIPGAIYDRASDSGGYEHSQKTHYKVVRDLFHRHGIYVAMYVYEEQKGGKINRKGYQELCRAVARHEIQAVGVDSMARLGRHGPERLRVLAEFDRLRVPCYCAAKQRADEPGIVRYVEAWQDEEELREKARKTVTNLPEAIKAGKHCGRTNIGYRRVYRFLDEKQTKVESVMVEDERYGPLVQRVFGDYADGLAVAAIVADLNAGPLPNPWSPDGKWTTAVVYRMLKCKTYLG